MIKPRATQVEGMWLVYSPGTYSRTGWTLRTAYQRWYDRNYTHVTRI